MYFFDKNESFYERTMLIVDSQEKRSYTYREIYTLQEQILSAAPSGSLLFLLCRNHPDCIAVYLGCLRMRLVPLLLDEQVHPDDLSRLESSYGPNLIFLPIERTVEFPEAILLWQDDGFALMQLRAEGPSMHPDLALLLTTSGSTGSPKLVRLSRRNLQSNAASIASYLEISQSDRPATTLPMEYTYGLSVLNSHLLAGAAILATERSFVEREFWDFFRRENGSSLAGVPYSYEILRRLHFSSMELPSLRVMTQAGGRLSPSLQEYFGKLAEERNLRFYIMYGQTEATARMSYLPWSMCLAKKGSIGIPIPGGRFELWDEENQLIPEAGREGQLVYWGGNVSLGYAETALDLTRGDEHQGCLLTGDLARRDTDGFYYITGRLKRFLKIAGKRLSLDNLEQLLARKWPLWEFACAGTDEAVRIYVAKTEKSQETADAISWFLSDHTNLSTACFQVSFIASIPRTAAGKIKYGSLPQ